MIYFKTIIWRKKIDNFFFLSVKWYIPFTYSVETLGSINSFTNQVNTSNLFNRISWIEKSIHKVIKLDKELKNDTYIIANLDMSGFYRVNYDDSNWLQISKQLHANHRVFFFIKSRAF